MSDTKIQWTDKTWNPVRGCSRVSPGCDHCYAMHFAHRFSGEGGVYEGLTMLRPKDAKRPGVDWSGRARFVPEMLGEPLKWRKPQRVFVNSMSDLFHESLTNEEIAAIFGVMAAAPQHTFQVLTKRPKRAADWFKWIGVAGGIGPWMRANWQSMRGYYSSGARFTTYRGRKVGSKDAAGAQVLNAAGVQTWPLPNVWLGVSTEDQKTADDRIPFLLETPAAVRFISAEPLLGDTTIWAYLKSDLRDRSLAILGGAPLPGLDWVIVGGESGNGARPFDLGWARALVEQCSAASIACFVKQVGADPIDGLAGCSVPFASKKGDDMSEWPAELRVRQFPEVRS